MPFSSAKRKFSFTKQEMREHIYEFAVMVNSVKNRSSNELFKEFKERKALPKRQKPPIVRIEVTKTVTDFMVMMFDAWLGAWLGPTGMEESLDEHLWDIGRHRSPPF